MVDKKGLFVLLFFGIFLISSVSASFNLGNPKHSLETVYGPSDDIAGWINISFSSEPLSSQLRDSRGNSENLSNVLKNNAIYTYSCNPKDCKDDYTESSPGQTKTVTLGPGESKIYGLKLTGDIFKIDSLKFTVESTAAASCTNQLEVDFLDDSSMDARNKNSVDSGSCSNKNYGCFDSGRQAEEPIVDSTPFCEKVVLSSSPGFFIGAWIKKVSGQRTIKASVYDVSGGEELASCILPDSTSSGGEVSCSVNYSVVSPREHYVCIRSTSGSGEYMTKGYSVTNGCGFHATPVPSLNPAAYQIFSQGKQFGAVGTIEMNKSVDGRSFAEMAESYLRSRYGSLNCSLGCVIPIKITSNSNQAITLKNLQVNYEKDIGIVVEKNFYDISKTAAKISSSFQKLYLDGSDFSVPSGFGTYTFSLQLNSQSVLSQQISVEDVPVIRAVTPTKAAAAYPTSFTLTVDSRYNLTSFSWDFGDNSSKITTSGNKSIHVYDSIGVYNLKVQVTDQRQLVGTKVFVINVSSPKDLINSSLSEKEKDIFNLEKEISSLSPFYQEALNASLNITYLKERVDFLRTVYENSTLETQYNALVTELVGLHVPAGISQSKSATDILLFPRPSYVDMSIVQTIGGGTYDTTKEEDYVNGVLVWQQENLKTNFDFNEFSGRYPGYTEPVAGIFEISFEEKRDIPYDYYLILPDLAGFTTDARFKREAGYIYINLKDEGPVSFSTTEDIDFTNLPAFISPAISRLTVSETLPEESNTGKWIVFSFALVSLLGIAFVIYIIMQEWYKRRYEDHLFGNRNDLYNMVNYVNNAKRKGLKNNEIEANLKRVGWSGEKIRYVMRKYAGKRTGMVELVPIRKLAEDLGGKPKSTK